MRTRDWRRHKEKIKIISRFKKWNRPWYHKYRDANGNNIESYIWVDQIGTDDHFMYKTYTTKNSKWKEKYGKKGSVYKRWSSDSKIGNRETNKVRFKKMLDKEYGIKHFNISYEFIKHYTEQ